MKILSPSSISDIFKWSKREIVPNIFQERDIFNCCWMNFRCWTLLTRKQEHSESYELPGIVIEKRIVIYRWDKGKVDWKMKEEMI